MIVVKRKRPTETNLFKDITRNRQLSAHRNDTKANQIRELAIHYYSKCLLSAFTNLGDVVGSDGSGRYRLSRRQVPQTRLTKKADKMTRISVPHPEKESEELTS